MENENEYKTVINIIFTKQEVAKFICRKDNNRKKYVENNLSLPPTILNERTQQYDISSDVIILGDGLF